MLTTPGPAGHEAAPADPSRPWQQGGLLWSPWFQAAAISVVGFVVILLTAPHGLWLDETISVRRSGLPLSTLTTFSLGGEPNMALFHYLLWPLGQLHASDTVFRLVPIAAGSLTLGGTYLLGCRLFDRRTAVIATLVMAAHGLLTRYATEVRGYSLIMLLMVVAALLLTDAVETDRAGRGCCSWSAPWSRSACTSSVCCSSARRSWPCSSCGDRSTDGGR